MKGWQALYLTRFFFIAWGAIALVFVLAFSWPFLRWVGLAIVVALGVLLVLDLVLLFRLKNPIRIQRKVARLLNLGDENSVVLTVENQTSFRLKLEIMDAYPEQLQWRENRWMVVLPEGGKQDRKTTFIPKTRGDYSFGDIWYYVSSPLGLAQRKWIIPLQQTTQVYPSILQMKKYELHVFHSQTQLSGLKKVRRIGHNNEFEQIKNYTQGDDVRTVNWKATSKRNELMVNQYQEERSQSIYSIIDKSRSMQTEFDGMTLLDYAINATLAFSNVALKKGDRVGLVTFSDKLGTQFAAERSTGHLRRIMHALYAQQTQFREANFEWLFESIHRTVKTRSLLLLYTNFESEYAMRRALPILKRIHQRHVLVVVFFQNNALEELAYQTLNTTEEVYQASIAEQLILRKTRIANELKQHGIQTILTRPEDLTTASINQYLALKAKGVI